MMYSTGFLFGGERNPLLPKRVFPSPPPSTAWGYRPKTPAPQLPVMRCTVPSVQRMVPIKA